MISFSKMHGLGNDFAVFYGDESQLMLISQKIKQLAHRSTGIGFDQLLFITKKENYYFHIFNANGSTASQCLNGARCVARFLIEKSYIHHREFLLENAAGIMEVSVNDFDNISLKILNKVKIFPEKIYMENCQLNLTRIFIGNDHLITTVKHLALLDVPVIGQACQSYIPSGINVGFAEIISDEELLLRTYERGAGETLCCASNTLAAVAVGIEQGWLKQTVIVKFPLGALKVSLNKDKEYFYLTGPASYCYEGKINL